MIKHVHAGILMMTIIILSCQPQDPNIDQSGQDELISHELNHKIDTSLIEYEDIYYVPIYSDIYVNTQNQNSLLAATLSVRNTSFKDSLFISKIDYFNTDGDLVGNFIQKSIGLPPMASINYVIEKEDTSGGAGANFIVFLSAKSKSVKPVIQAVMIGENGNNQGFAFTTEGYSIKDQ
jgi:hypothetical protein